MGQDMSVATRRYGTIVRHLTDDPLVAVELAQRLDDDVLVHLAAALGDETRRRAVEQGDQQAVIDDAFDHGFGRDGMGVLPYIEGPFIVCPGAMVSKRKANHTCRFVSVNDVWIWDSYELVHEEKRSSPGTDDGFRAVALLTPVEGMELDVVSGRLRSGQHQVDLVVSFVVRKGDLIEVSQRNVAAMRSHTN
ncbi:hypothetical protein K0U73_17545 [bacterium]|nr:hypothetical protein [Acidimicrobiaceae bacterium]MCH9805593.1 hypothetical protein [bacterium]